MADVMAKVDAGARPPSRPTALDVDIEVDGGHRRHHGAGRRGRRRQRPRGRQRHLRAAQTVGGRRRHPGRGPHRQRSRVTPRRAVVAGGGIIGTWHALELAEAGFSVDHLEAEAGPTGASVRNFGLIWVSGRRTGAELDVARARPPALGGDRHAGARHRLPPDELAHRRHRHGGPLGDARRSQQHPDAAARRISFLEPDDVRACNPAVRGDVEGALHCTRGRGGRAPAGAGRPARPHRGDPREPLPVPSGLPRRPGRAARARRLRPAPAGRGTSSSSPPAPPTTISRAPTP